ncbi:MAG: DUF3299 domain-containing protein [Gammaproteobacteria bacterium]|nr:DUF3299 domain-containing protein [Gammaproteobacteria bacterium]
MTFRSLVLLAAVLMASCSKSGPKSFDEPVTEIDWQMLGEIDLISGEVPAPLKALEGQLVKLPGFIAPIDTDGEGQVRQFAIVPYQGACIHTPPPPPNQMVYVPDTGEQYAMKMEDDSVYIPYWFTGRLALTPQESAFGPISSNFTPLADMVPWEPPEETAK